MNEQHVAAAIARLEERIDGTKALLVEKIEAVGRDVKNVASIEPRVRKLEHRWHRLAGFVAAAGVFGGSTTFGLIKVFTKL